MMGAVGTDYEVSKRAGPKTVAIIRSDLNPSQADHENRFVHREQSSV
jgi:hypothetical protein